MAAQIRRMSGVRRKTSAVRIVGGLGGTGRVWWWWRLLLLLSLLRVDGVRHGEQLLRELRGGTAAIQRLHTVLCRG
jgi:hypothetical protein